MMAEREIAGGTPTEPVFRMVGDAAGPGCAGDVCDLPAPAHPLPDEALRD
jgi:hypothetical protein